MMEHTTDRLFWTLTSMLVAALILTIGINAFPKATQNVIQPISGVIKQADRVESTSNDAANKAMNDLGSSNTSSSTNNTTQTVDQDAIDRANAVDASSVNLQVTDNGDGTGTITKWNLIGSRDMNIPKYVKVNGKVLKITVIGEMAFRNGYLLSLTIPNSVTTIQSYAFQNNYLTSVTIPDSVISIGADAFQDNRLTSVSLGNSVQSLGYLSFSGNKISSITIPNSLTKFGGYDFYANPITNINIPNAQGYKSAMSMKNIGFSPVPQNATITNNPS